MVRILLFGLYLHGATYRSSAVDNLDRVGVRENGHQIRNHRVEVVEVGDQILLAIGFLVCLVPMLFSDFHELVLNSLYSRTNSVGKFSEMLLKKPMELPRILHVRAEFWETSAAWNCPSYAMEGQKSGKL